MAIYMSIPRRRDEYDEQELKMNVIALSTRQKLLPKKISRHSSVPTDNVKETNGVHNKQINKFVHTKLIDNL